MTTKPVYPTDFPDDGSISCLICYERGADRHVYQEEEGGLYYGGISFHAGCWDKLKKQGQYLNTLDNIRKEELEVEVH